MSFKLILNSLTWKKLQYRVETLRKLWFHMISTLDQVLV